MTQLTEARIRTAKPREHAYKLFDERGLFLFVTPTDMEKHRAKGGERLALATHEGEKKHSKH